MVVLSAVGLLFFFSLVELSTDEFPLNYLENFSGSTYWKWILYAVQEISCILHEIQLK
jgi:hypothetical protein